MTTVRLALVIFLMCIVSTTHAAVFDITAYGAVGDGVSLNTAAIQKAVDACAGTGGRVVIPAGVFVSGTIFMKSGVTLHFEHGATLLGSPRLADYPETSPALRSYTDRYVNRSLIYGERLTDIGITGDGVIDGNGHGPEFQEAGYANRTRPYIIRFIECKTIRVRNIRLRSSPMWMQHYLACEDIVMDGVSVYNHGNRNNDSLDLDGCRNVTVSNCLFDSDDDALTLKSTSPAVTEYIAITNCVVSSHCNAIKMGTESTGGFRNIVISNCVVKPSADHSVVYGRPDGLAGLALELVDGGLFEFVTVTNLTIERVSTPLFIRLGNRARKYTDDAPDPPMGVMRHIVISNVIGRGTSAIPSSITGLPDACVEDVSLSNIRIISPGGGAAEDAHVEVPEKADSYPESAMFGTLPASGLYVRHVKGLALDNVRLVLDGPDERSAVVMEDVDGLDIDGFRGSAPSGNEAVMRLVDTRHALLRGCGGLGDMKLFLKVEGPESGDITLGDNALDRAEKVIELGEGVAETAVRAR